jgi:hypothetical protein
LFLILVVVAKCDGGIDLVDQRLRQTGVQSLAVTQIRAKTTTHINKTQTTTKTIQQTNKQNKKKNKK